jgi:hypothetical protein
VAGFLHKRYAFEPLDFLLNPAMQSLLIIPAVLFVALVAIFGIRQAPGIFLGIAAACAVIYATAAILHA